MVGSGAAEAKLRAETVPKKQPFADAVRRVVRDLRRGDVVSYGEVARRAGYPRAARAVGNVLAVTHGLPWWRVVRANGDLAAQSRLEQARRLRSEGVTVRDGGVKDHRGSRKPAVGRQP
ncbi:MAG: methylated-DNA-protein-cysteine methyltransferase related protein [Chloroflexota bacterium]|nr:methylated-DNA-protein-cysteine methyltransferase related protein [Chloroflexota bacterium]